MIASRLTENPAFRVLLLEAGGDPTPVSRVPLLAPLTQFIPGNNWNYFTEPQRNACRGYRGNRCPVVRGKVFGGSSQLNYVIFSRGHPRDYDAWAEMGNEGWSYKEVLPYFMKSERSHMTRDVDPAVHNTSGLQDTGFAPWKRVPVVEAYLEAFKELGYEQVDYNGYKQVGYSEMQAFIKGGERADVITEFIEPFRDRSNLVIRKRSFVTKVLFEDGAAYGVEYRSSGKTRFANASKEVVLSAGVINSPQLLMLSGVGLQDELSRFGISVVRNLSVGRNLQEHVIYPAFIFKHKSLSSVALNPLYLLRWLFARKGPFATPGGVPGVAFLNTTALADPYPDVELSVCLFSFAMSFAIAYPRLEYVIYFLKHALSPSFTILSSLLKPKSRGYVKLRSGDPFEHPSIVGNYLQHPDDLRVMVNAVRYTLKVVRTGAMRKLGVEVVEDKVPDCSELEYDTEEYWVCAVRHLATSIYHPSGTCKMGPESDSEAVVDSKLKVHGVKRLRVADTSIIPLLPNCHTHAPALMIGEKAADMIKQEWQS